MQTDDDSQTTLSKWPFIFGDILLVASALAIAILGGWQLTDWQVASCVIAVALGAGLFVLPYIVEFRVRVREEQEDRAADLRILEKHILSAEKALDGVDARIRALESASASAQAPNSALADLLDQKLAQMEQGHADRDAAIHALKKELSAMPKAFDPAVLKPLLDRLDALEKRPALGASTAPGAKAASERQAPKKPSAAPVADDQKAPVKPRKTAAPIEASKGATRAGHKPEESNLLKRAMTEKQDSSSTAVSRIIESKPKEAPVEGKNTPAKNPAVKSEPKEPEQEEAPAAKVDEPESVQPEKVEKKDEGPGSDAAVPAPENADMLFNDAVVSAPVKKTKVKKNDAVLTASVFIGIGNKPYLRGSGGGLSWERGLAMEFQEIGKWRWVAPSDLNGALEIQLFRNDEDPDKSGKYKLEPGQKLEVSPVF